MKEEGIVINDLHGYVMPRFTELHKPHDLHYLPAGSDFLANSVAEIIELHLPDAVVNKE